MFYLVAGSLIAVFVILSTINSSKKKKKKIIEQIRASWGKTKSGPFTFERIERYAALSGGNGYHRIGRQTMNDIDFLELFSFVDRTNSKIGQQFLFNQLLHPSNDQKALDLLNQRALLFANDQQLREDVQKELIRLSDSDAYFVTSLLEKKLLERPSWLNLIYVSIFSVVALLALSFVNPIFLILLLLPLTINSFVHYWNKTNTFLFLRSFPQLSLLINVCDNVSRKNLHYNVEHVRESVTALKPFMWKMGFIRMSPGGSIKDELGQVATYLVELLRGFLLIEVLMLFELIKELETKRDSIQILFDHVGNIDTALSVASLRAGDLKTCAPELTPPMRELRVKKIYHPLITNCVKNDLHVKDKSILITGSNMSGKTTFLRTVAINSLLAQTIYTCFADEFQSPMLRPYSSIRIDDNVLEGKSYYYQEVNTMGSLIKEVHSPYQNLFLLDEVFKGTNTVERIASAKATLSYLNQGANLVVVSTHDLELPSMLQDQFDLYHFSESIKDGQLHFDHKIKPGPLLTGNAIKILEMSDYPEKIISEAKELGLTLSSP
jgi:DNA mismatch repair ATPase MutS